MATFIGHAGNLWWSGRNTIANQAKDNESRWWISNDRSNVAVTRRPKSAMTDAMVR